jgi:hypothetical protein
MLFLTGGVRGDQPGAPTQGPAGVRLYGGIFYFEKIHNEYNECEMDRNQRLGLLLVIAAACMSVIVFMMIALI